MPPTVRITSAKNETVRSAAALLTSRGRREQGRFLLEGPKLLTEAAAAGCEIETVFFCDAEALARCGDAADCAARLIETTPEILRKLSDTVTPQGVTAVARRDHPPALPLTPASRLLLLENIQNAGNAGNMLRTAEALGIDGLLFCGTAVDILSPKVLRGSMGSALRLPTAHFDTPAALSAALKTAGLPLWGAALTEAALPLQRLALPAGVVAIGNEGAGLTDELLACCDGTVIIPMSGPTESLSAPIAAAILLWELWGRSVPCP
ncbi:MAG: RNA methyltransferase [Clostridia bacterium]|nr:RNA methyltransferase [Clostridia bacterium]